MSAAHVTRRQLARSAFRRNRLAFVSLWVLAVLAFIAVFAEFFAPYTPQERNRNYPDGPPMAVHFFGTPPSLYVRKTNAIR